jgi:hypothetical protein
MPTLVVVVVVVWADELLKTRKASPLYAGSGTAEPKVPADV